ncbi:hypothetical protein JNM05_06525 [bacterium]|nr:hypothetical protein [bacterium]
MQKNREICKLRINEHKLSGGDPVSIYKSLLTYASQHALSDHANMNAVIFSDCLVNLLQASRDKNAGNWDEKLIEYGIDYFCTIPIEPIDTTPLKPSRKEAKVASIADLEESFDQNDINVVMESVRDLLTLMDNKRYFMEITFRIALKKNPHCLILASAISRAIEIMGWQNNFTPFLIYHLIVRLHNEKTTFSFSKRDTETTNVFEQCLGKVRSIGDLLFLAASFRTYHESKILAAQLLPMIRMRLNEYFGSKRDADHVIENKQSTMDSIVRDSCFLDLSSVKGIEALRSKNPFAV